jgi:hypothetical protein
MFPLFARAFALVSVEYRMEFHASGIANVVLFGVGGEWRI